MTKSAGNCGFSYIKDVRQLSSPIFLVTFNKEIHNGKLYFLCSAKHIRPYIIMLVTECHLEKSNALFLSFIQNNLEEN